MVKIVLLLFLAIILITFLRGVIGLVGKAFTSLADPKTPARKADELKRDPVCGVYVPAATSVKRTVKGEVVHFCSEQCAERWRG
jgi:YHS domain-containing protein